MKKSLAELSKRDTFYYPVHRGTYQLGTEDKTVYVKNFQGVTLIPITVSGVRHLDIVTDQNAYSCTYDPLNFKETCYGLHRLLELIDARITFALELLYDKQLKNVSQDAFDPFQVDVKKLRWTAREMVNGTQA